MSVIINDFEIDIAPAQTPSAAGGDGAATPPPSVQPSPPQVRPLDITTVLNQQAQRQSRLRAH